MDRLKLLIQQSKNWTSLSRGRELAEAAAEFLQNVLAVDAGIFAYKRRLVVKGEKQGLQIYKTWGVRTPVEQLLSQLTSFSITSPDSTFFTECWLPVSEISNSDWKKVWEEAGIHYIGTWPIVIQGEISGILIYGIKQLVTSQISYENELMSLLSLHFSLFFEMLVMRRIAEESNRRDSLTGILNRRGCIEEITAIQLNQKYQLYMTGILDIDNFKEINDERGHINGDQILQDVAQTLEQITGETGLCARFGGDEFVFFIPTEQQSELLIECIHSYFKDKPYSVSIGCYPWNPKEEWLISLHHADQHMYARKAEAKCKM